MEIYLLLGTVGIIIYLVAAYYQRVSTTVYSYTIIVITYNCADICEGVIRDILTKRSRLGNHNIIVIDKCSNDETYEILKNLSSKYIFPLGKIERENFELKKKLEHYVISMNGDTTYFGAREQLKSIKYL